MLVKSRPKFVTLGLLGAMMALLIVGLMYTQKSVQASDGSEHVPSGAIVTTQGAVAPDFECKWELPDMTIVQNSPDFPSARTNQANFYPDPYEVEYQHATENEINAPIHGGHDDDFGSVLPSTGLYPCFGPETGQLPMQIDGVMNMITVRPRLGG